MNYLINKGPEGDSRKGICGVVIPDGFFVVVEYAEENQQQLRNIRNLQGELYTVTKTDLPVGHYAPNGCRVTLDSVWNWYLEGADLDYVDGAPADGVKILSKKNEVRPPDLTDRPEYIGLNALPEDAVDLPPAVLKAREHFAALEAAKVEALPATGHAASVKSEIPVESDMDTLSSVGATDEVAMLRAALDARGIKYHPTAKAPALKKKLQGAEEAA
jgi:hypothetical protein